MADIWHNQTVIRRKDDCYHHCASVVEHDGSLVVAAYYGRECTDEQRVFIWCNDLILDLPPKTGNPVLWSENGILYLLYSVFSDSFGDLEGPVDRWKYCTNRLAIIEISSKINIISDNIVDDAYGLLGRCAPIMIDNRSVWPLYREKDPRCEIWTLKSGSLEKIGHFGDKLEDLNDAKFGSLGHGVAIQPTLFEANNTIYAFCRNVTANANRAWAAEAEDRTLKNWTRLQYTDIPNFNSSLIVIPGINIVLINDAPGRENMFMFTLGATVRSFKIDIPMPGRRQSTGYPNYCFTMKGVAIVHSNRNNIVLHHMSKDFIRVVFGRTMK